MPIRLRHTNFFAFLTRIGWEKQKTEMNNTISQIFLSILVICFLNHKNSVIFFFKKMKFEILTKQTLFHEKQFR